MWRLHWSKAEQGIVGYPGGKVSSSGAVTCPPAAWSPARHCNTSMRGIIQCDIVTGTQRFDCRCQISQLSKMRSINLKIFKVSNLSFGYNINDSVLTFFMLAIHWCPDGGWEWGNRLKCTDRQPGSTYFLWHISISDTPLRNSSFAPSLYFLCMWSKGFSCIDYICIKKELECGLLLTSRSASVIPGWSPSDFVPAPNSPPD